ncbi:MAG TPA: hypothetical protein VK623_00295, partial [Flavobacterium sp.]|nr:hypothetical protein [Flavobacterium sp.]
MPEIIVLSENQHAISGDLANHYRVLPKALFADSMELYIDDLCDSGQAKDELELFLGKQIDFIPIDTAEIERALSIYYRKERQEHSS